jgi:hypothetical protein
MYSDTWPNKDDFWAKLLPDAEGRLGLFHFQKRIISTLRKNHIDCMDAITDLLACIYQYCPEDYEKLLEKLKDGSLSSSGKAYSSQEINDMSRNVFRDRYAKYLRKLINKKQTIIQGLDDWFCKYKVTAVTDPINRPARGRLDPIKGFSLFTETTKDAVENCKLKAQYLADPAIALVGHVRIHSSQSQFKASANRVFSRRGESKLESFHDRLAHFANCGMRDTLADNLNLAGTATWNLVIRHKRSLCGNFTSVDERKKLPDAWDRVVPYRNHSELWYVNNLAMRVGLDIPFPRAERLLKDNGERFFSEYITNWSKNSWKNGDVGKCLCDSCTVVTASPIPPVVADATAIAIIRQPASQAPKTNRVILNETERPAALITTTTRTAFVQAPAPPRGAPALQRQLILPLQQCSVPDLPILCISFYPSRWLL